MAAEPVVEKSATEPIADENENQPSSLSASMKVYPNPNNGQFTLFTQEEELPESVSIYNSKGQKIKQVDNISTLQFNILNETPGLYVVRVTWHNKDASQKFIIR